MNKYLKSALVILLLFACSGIHAQLKSYYVIGANFSTMTLKLNGISYETKTPAGVHFGELYEIPVYRNLALQAAFMFSAKGTDYYVDTIRISLSPVYIEIPVNISYSIGSPSVRVTLFSGPYFACAIGGYRLESGKQIRDLNYGSGVNNDMRFIDLGYNAGASLQVKGFLVSFQYGVGMSNVAPVRTLDSVMKNKVIGISVRFINPGVSH